MSQNVTNFSKVSDMGKCRFPGLKFAEDTRRFKRNPADFAIFAPGPSRDTLGTNLGQFCAKIEID
jgi:hypothetical protein